MRPETMVTSGDTEASVEVVDEGPDSRLEGQRHPVGGHTGRKCQSIFFSFSLRVVVGAWYSQAQHGNEENERDIEPVDVLVPVLQRNGLVGDVRLLGVEIGFPNGLIVGRSVRKGRSRLHRLGGWRRHGEGKRERDVVWTVDAQDKTIPRTWYETQE